MINYELLHLVESVLGSSEHKKDGNYGFKCPKCSQKYNDSKKKLEVDINTTKTLKNYFHCWRCDFKGTNLRQLFKGVNSDRFFVNELEKLVKYDRNNFQNKEFSELTLPKEFVPLYDYSKMSYFDKKLAQNSIKYLKNRNISEIDIVKYNIGICSSGKYNGRIIFPSYNMFNELNIFTGRYHSDVLPSTVFTSYMKPTVDESVIIPFENLINFNLPIILCEGVFDALAIKVNAIPLFGKTMSEKLKQTLLSEKVKDIYICLDKDAKKKALQYVELFYKNSKNVYFVELNGKDPSTLGYEQTWKAILTAKQAEFKDILYQRIHSIN